MSRATSPPNIAVGNDPVSLQLQAWWKEGTAAGNLGDWYDNRDRNHSGLSLSQFPQLLKIKYTDEEIRLNLDYGASTRIRQAVVVGNASTAFTADLGGSNPRFLYVRPGGMSILHSQYRANNVYVYPEHTDHDSGTNGRGGWGDLFPLNQPYLLISQGSSGSDQPFVRALVQTLAAFRPETKQRLTNAGLVMPTLQMILRQNLRNATNPDAYFSGLAHPSAFASSQLDELAMIRQAHEITPDALPPLAQLRVLSEDIPTPDVDYFDSSRTEAFADTPGAIARLWRGGQATRRLVVSAESSLDANDRPLTFRWAVLRGDPRTVTVRPLNAAGSIVEIRARRPSRRAIRSGSSLLSSRIDVAAFVHNGTWWSAPAFVTWYSNDRELRTEDAEERLAELANNAVTPFVHIPKLTPFLQWLGDGTQGAGPIAFATLLGPASLATILDAAPAILAAESSAATASFPPAAADPVSPGNRSPAPGTTSRTSIDPKRIEPRSSSSESRAVRTSPSAADVPGSAPPSSPMNRTFDSLATTPPNPVDTVRNLLVNNLSAWLRDPNLTRRHASMFGEQLAASSATIRDAFRMRRDRLSSYGLRDEGDGWSFTGVVDPDWYSGGEISELSQLNLAVLRDLVRPGGITLVLDPNYLDTRLFPERPWRDVYQFDEAGRCLGWRRYSTSAPSAAFTADGYLVLTRDERGRAATAASVTYARALVAGQDPEASPLAWQRGNRFFTYLYEGPADRRGQALEDR